VRSSGFTAGKCDLVLHGGTIYGHPGSDSIAIAGGRIAAHGPFSELKALVGPRTHLMKLGGRTVAPGLIDSHLHFMEAASVNGGVQVSKARNLGELLLELRAASLRTAPGNWLKAFGCDEALLLERRGPTRLELDEAVTKNPLRLRHQTLHASWLNSRAIVALGLEKPDFKPPAGATLELDATRRLTGLVVGMEEWLTQRLPPVTSADLEARARIFSRELAASGVTAFTDATVRNGPDEVRLFARLVTQRAIGQRVGLMIGGQHLSHLGEARQGLATSGVSILAAKFMDVAQIEPRALARAALGAVTHGLACAFHATEVEELEAALVAIEAVRRHFGGDTPVPAPMRIEHGGMIPPNYLDRLVESGAWVVTNPGFVYFRGVKYLSEPGLIPHLYRARSLTDAGVPVAGGTDAPVTPPKPLAAIAAAAARVTLEGYELARDEKLDIADAYALFAKSAAELWGIQSGEIIPDLLADLIVLQHDPLTLSPAEITNLQVDLTMVGGRVVYERGRPEVATSIPAL
jgi:predicted amidohydrolase YtcJ